MRSFLLFKLISNTSLHLIAHQNGATTNHESNGASVHHRLISNSVQSHRTNGHTAQSHRPNGVHPTVQGYLSVTRQIPRHTLIPSTGSAFHTPPLRYCH